MKFLKVIQASRARYNRALKLGKACEFECFKCSLKFISQQSLTQHHTQTNYRIICDKVQYLFSLVRLLDDIDNGNTDSDSESSDSKSEFDTFEHKNDDVISVGSTESTQPLDVLNQMQVLTAAELFTSEYGAFGPWVEELGNLLQLMHPHGDKTFFVLCGINITYTLLYRIIAGIRFDQNETSTTFFHGLDIENQEAYLFGSHIDIVTNLLNSDNYQSNSDELDLDSPVCFSPCILQTFRIDQGDCMNFIREFLVELGLLSDQGFLATVLLFPHTRGDHFILLLIDCGNNKIHVLDPLSKNPAESDVELALALGDALHREFGIGPFVYELYAKELPRQTDGFNCGIFVIMYLVSFCLKRSDIFMFTVNEFRCFLLQWILTKHIELLLKNVELDD